MLRVGTASWTDPTLVRDSDWYPRKSMSAEARLRYYASIFPMVEVDATYYYPPTRELAGLWVDRTPDDFRFNIKAYSLLTQHPTKPSSLWDDIAGELAPESAGKRSVYLSSLPPDAVDRAFDHFVDALLPLESAGKLGAVFCQFPPWFVASRDNRRYLESLTERLGGYPVAVEFRHASWMDTDTASKTLGLLSEAGLTYVCVDEPQGFRNSVPPVLAVTSDLAVVRFHGHNSQTWNARNITPAERFRYLYSGEELAEWAPRVRALAADATETHVVFNNCYRDYGVRNARELGALLEEGLQAGEDAPPHGASPSEPEQQTLPRL